MKIRKNIAKISQSPPNTGCFPSLWETFVSLNVRRDLGRNRALGMLLESEVRDMYMEALLLFPKLNKLFRGYFDPDNIFLGNKN